MKALSIRQPWASMIASGRKTIEVRSWSTSYRGDLLICAGKKICGHLPVGVALAVVTLTNCRGLTPADVDAAGCPFESGQWAWILERVRIIRSFPVVGQLGLFEVHVSPAALLSLSAAATIFVGTHTDSLFAGNKFPVD